MRTVPSGAAEMVGEIVEGGEVGDAVDVGAPDTAGELPEGATLLAVEGAAPGAPLTCADAIAVRATALVRAIASAPTSAADTVAIH